MTTFVEQSQPKEPELADTKVRDSFRGSLAFYIGEVSRLAQTADTLAKDWVEKVDERTLAESHQNLHDLETSLRHALAVVNVVSSRTVDYMNRRSRP